jgi:hypothetical protein
MKRYLVNSDEIIPVYDAARILNVDCARVNDLISSGELETFDFHGTPLLFPAGLATYIMKTEPSGAPCAVSSDHEPTCVRISTVYDAIGYQFLYDPIGVV